MKKKIFHKLLIVMLVCAVLGGSLVAGLNLLVLQKSSRYILSDNVAAASDADCILVLGCGLIDSQTPSFLLADRIDQGVNLYKKGVSGKLLMSGDHGRADYDEVNVMKACAVRSGVPTENVFMDHAGFSTYESMYRAKEIFGAKKILIVTQKYHLYRAVFIARSLGLDAYGCAAADIAYPNQIQREVRELAARCKDVLFSAVKPLPTYLGDPISLAGSGTVTDDENTKNFV